MADNDQSLTNLRYNQITQNLEAFGGGSPQWTLVTLKNVDPTQVPVTRLINTTAPLVGGGDLSANRTLSIPAANGSTNGYLLAADWTTFNNKQNLLTFGNLTDVGTDGIVITGGTGAVIGTGTSLAQHIADSTHNGYLSSADWTTFNNKLNTALTHNNIFIGNPGNAAVAAQMIGDASLDYTGTLTLATVNSNVGSFTSANITVNAKGQITAASNGSGGGGTPGGADTQVQFNNSGAFGGSPNLTFDGTNITSGGAFNIGAHGSVFYSADSGGIVISNTASGLSLILSDSGPVQLPQISADPSPVAGAIYFNSTTSKVRYSDGTTWFDL